jgi:hypothetical protein
MNLPTPSLGLSPVPWLITSFRASALLVLAASACAPLQKTTPATTERLGKAIVLSAHPITISIGDSKIKDVAIGSIAGGVAGLIITAQEEDSLGAATKQAYELRMSDGSLSTVQSFSIAAANDCVLMSRFAYNHEVVLERTTCGNWPHRSNFRLLRHLDR